MLRTDNNVPISKFIYSMKFDIPVSSIYQYQYNFNTDMLNRYFDVDYINYGTDAIIRDILFLSKGKKIFFEKPNYMMVEKYANAFDMEYTSFDDCDVAYISYPNGVTLNNPKFEFKRYNKTIILDLSYYIYQVKNFDDFINEVNYFRSLGYFLLFGASKILGLPGLRVGMCAYEYPEVFNYFHQPTQISAPSYYILKRLWNAETINKHVDIINKSKEYFKEYFKDYIAFETEEPFIALTKDYKPKSSNEVRDCSDYYRFSVIDKDLYK